MGRTPSILERDPEKRLLEFPCFEESDSMFGRYIIELAGDGSSDGGCRSSRGNLFPCEVLLVRFRYMGIKMS